LRWTAQHVQLLKCRFVPRPPTPQPASSTQARLTPPSESEQAGEDSKHPLKQKDIGLRRALCRLARGNNLLFKRWGLERLFEAVSNDHVVTSLPKLTALEGSGCNQRSELDVLGKATPWRVSNGHIDQAQLQLFGAIMIDGTFPVMAMALSVVEKGELIETKTIHPVSNISLLQS
jgi:hypothetical protein